MPPRTSHAWLRAAFALDAPARLRPAGLPPLFLCPAVKAISTRPRPLCHHQPIRRGIASVAAAAESPAGIQAVRDVRQEGAAMGGPEPPERESQGQLQAAGPPESTPNTAKPRKLPLQCPGCGAFSQTTDASQPGYYDLNRQSTLEYLGLRDPIEPRARKEDKIVQEALSRLDPETLASLDLDGLLEDVQKKDETANNKAVHKAHVDNVEAPGTSDRPPEASFESSFNSAFDPESHESPKAAPTPKPAADTLPSADTPPPPPPLCRRCHNLVHHSSGKPIFHPSVDAIRETLAESPYKYNHVYHVLDAADFPMSLLPRIHDVLETVPLRSRNRRARARFFSNRRTELSFVITRSDLLAPRRGQVDSLMPWIRETLMDGLAPALRRLGRNVRLGTVHLVSAKRNWWTSELKEEIWNRGGATWLVGKANVGKSFLVHHVFPKGRMDSEKEQAKIKAKKPIVLKGELAGAEPDMSYENYDAEQDLNRSMDEDALLPPRPAETNYPAMPVVSSLAGTTASPIRIPFGNGRGELIDLPGLSRTRLADYVDAEHREEMIMKARIEPEQVTLKGPHQSLLLGGGLIRITPRTPGLVFLAYNFTPLRDHRTSTSKALGVQAEMSDLTIESITAEDSGERIKHAGSFPLKYDVTKIRAGPITSKKAINISVDRLPYRVVALDVVIEGCGWVEIVAQVRAKDFVKPPKPKAKKVVKKFKDESGPAPNEPDSNGILQSLDLSMPFEPVQKTRSRRRSASLEREREHEAEEEEAEEEPEWPVIDVYSPEGKFVTPRRPLNAWMLRRPKSSGKSTRGRAKRKRAGY